MIVRQFQVLTLREVFTKNHLNSEPYLPSYITPRKKHFQVPSIRNVKCTYATVLRNGFADFLGRDEAKFSATAVSSWEKLLFKITFPFVGLGGLGVTYSPRDPKFADSYPAELDGFFQDVEILSTSLPGGTFSWGYRVNV